MDHLSFQVAFEAELMRLGLPLAELPGLATQNDHSASALLARLRSLPPGATWQQVFPTLPHGLSPLAALTRPSPYRPFGPWDHPRLPTGPAIHVVWQKAMSSTDWLDELRNMMLRAGIAVYGIGRPASSSFTHEQAVVVLKANCPPSEFAAALEWLNEQQDVTLAAVPRTGEETYLDS